MTTSAFQSTATSTPGGSSVAGEEKVLRITPSHVDEDARVPMSKMEEKDKAMDGVAKGPMTFDEKRLKYMRNLLRLQVERIHKLEPAITADGSEYKKYLLDLNGQPTRVGEHSKTHTAKNREHLTVPMVVKVYEGGLASFANPLYLKFLRHLGKKHPFVLQTWDIFTNDKDQVLVVQEFANRMDMTTLLKKKGPQNEQRLYTWAAQLHKALDYLGEMAICHRG